MKLLLIGLMASVLGGQTIRIETSAEAVPLAGIWKQQSGDDPGRADPAFDDSGWNSVEMPAKSKPGVRGYTWYRIRVELPEGDRPLVVAVGPLFPAYQIFANGRKIGAFGGDLGSPVGQYYAEPAVFPLPRSERNIVLTIRSFDSALFLGGEEHLPGRHRFVDRTRRGGGREAGGVAVQAD